MLYPEPLEPTAGHHAAVFRWAQRRGLPVPRLYAELPGALVVEDLGEVPLRQALGTQPEQLGLRVLDVLAAFQGQSSGFALNPPFDRALFWRELFQFLEYVGLAHSSSAVTDFCRQLADQLTTHPYRLCHRDFHLDNLLLTDAGVKTVDFQDMRFGPDTYDVASLLRERGGSQLFPAAFAAQASAVLRWEAPWQERFWQCAAQRGLKALGTFLKLAHEGRPQYLQLIPEVATQALDAVRALDGPRELVARLRNLSTPRGV